MSRLPPREIQNYSVSGKLETTPEFYKSPHGVTTGLLNVLVSTFETEVRTSHRFVSVYLAKSDEPEKLYFIVNLTSSASLDNPIYKKILSGQCEELSGVTVNVGHRALQSFFFLWTFDAEIQQLFDKIFKRRISLSNVSFYKKYLHKCFIEQLTLVRKDNQMHKSTIDKLASISGFEGVSGNGQGVLLHILSKVNGPKTSMESLNDFFAKSVNLDAFNEKLADLLGLYYNFSKTSNNSDIRETTEWQLAKETGIDGLVRLLEKALPPIKVPPRRSQTQSLVQPKGIIGNRNDHRPARGFGYRTSFVQYDGNENANTDLSSPTKFTNRVKTTNNTNVETISSRKYRNGPPSFNVNSYGDTSARKPRRSELDTEEANDFNNSPSSFTVNRRHREDSQTRTQDFSRNRSRDSSARDYGKNFQTNTDYNNSDDDDVYGSNQQRSVLQVQDNQYGNEETDDYVNIREQPSHRSGKRVTSYKANPYK